MNFGSTHNAALDLKSKSRISNSKFSSNLPPARETSRILERSRLTEEDLEEFLLNINEQHKKKHRKVLMISGMLLIVLTIIILYLNL